MEGVFLKKWKHPLGSVFKKIFSGLYAAKKTLVKIFERYLWGSLPLTLQVMKLF